jgi:hypothetical protein
MCDAFREAHFLVLPTLADATPIVFSEAQAFGLPPISYDVGGVGGAISHGRTGLLLPPGAPAELFAEGNTQSMPVIPSCTRSCRAARASTICGKQIGSASSSPTSTSPTSCAPASASLARQAFDMRRVEIIVVDNGSRQPPTDICSASMAFAWSRSPFPAPARRAIAASAWRAGISRLHRCRLHCRPRWLGAIEAALTRPGGSMVIGGDVRIARRDPRRATMLEAYESIYAYRQEEYIARQGFSGHRQPRHGAPGL